MSADEVKQLLTDAEGGEKRVTPWFKLICDKFLFTWWKQLDHLSPYMDKEIHRFC